MQIKAQVRFPLESYFNFSFHLKNIFIHYNKYYITKILMKPYQI